MARTVDADEVSNTQDIIDSRTVQARIEELEGDQENAVGEWAEFLEDWAEGGSAREASEVVEKYNVQVWGVFLRGEDSLFGPDEAEELVRLLALKEEVEAVSGEGWDDGAGLIADSYFEEYAQDLAEDIGAINKDAAWPNDCIDWKAAADALKQDYSSVDYDGNEYWVRS